MNGALRVMAMGLLLAACSAPLATPLPTARPSATPEQAVTAPPATALVPTTSPSTVNSTNTPRREPPTTSPDVAKPTPAPPTAVSKSQQPAPAATAAGNALFKFRREGGFAGFCDELHILPGDIVVRYTCKAGRVQEVGRRRLTQTEARVLQGARSRLQSLSVVQRDKAVADAMTVTVILQGTGGQVASPAEQSALIEFATDLLSGVFDSEM